MTFVSEFGSTGTGVGQFNRTRAVAVNSQDRIIIADRENGRIQLCDDQGACTAFGSVGSAVGNFIQPQGIAVDGLDQVLVSDFGNRRVQICDNSGSCTAFGSDGSALGQFSDVVGIDVDSQDRIFVADPANNRIQICDHQGSCTAFSIGFVQGLAIDSQDRVIVADSVNHRIQICDDQGTCTPFGSQGSEPGQFDGPLDVAVDNSGRIYVADAGNHRIQICDFQGNCLLHGSHGSGPGQLDTPSGITVDGQGRIIVGDTANDRIEIFGLGTETPSVSVVAASVTYPAGTTFDADSVDVTSMTADPLGPFTGQSVHFEGINRQGVRQVFRYRLDFIQAVALDSIVLEGRAWLESEIRLLDEQQNIITTFHSLPGGNSFQRHVLDVSGIAGKTFFLDEENGATIWRYRSLIEINFSGGFLGN